MPLNCYSFPLMAQVCTISRDTLSTADTKVYHSLSVQGSDCTTEVLIEFHPIQILSSFCLAHLILAEMHQHSMHQLYKDEGFSRRQGNTAHLMLQEV